MLTTKLLNHIPPFKSQNFTNPGITVFWDMYCGLVETDTFQDNTLMIPAVITSETLVNFYQTIWRSTQADRYVLTRHHENLKSHLYNCILQHLVLLRTCIIYWCFTPLSNITVTGSQVCQAKLHVLVKLVIIKFLPQNVLNLLHLFHANILHTPHTIISLTVF
jgi:hypothetical protein